MLVLPPSGRRVPPPPRKLLPGPSSYGLIRQSRLALLSFGLWPPSRSLCRLLPALLPTGSSRRYLCQSFLRCLSPYPGGPSECLCLVLPQSHRPSPTKAGSASRFYPRTRFSAARVSRLQLFRYLQASEIARLPDRSYRCRFLCRAAEAFTSELNVRRYLRTHRICYPPDYRQLAVRGLSPRWIRSLVGCSPSLHRSYPASSLLRA
jgi:hypothetical protein